MARTSCLSSTASSGQSPRPCRRTCRLCSPSMASSEEGAGRVTQARGPQCPLPSPLTQPPVYPQVVPRVPGGHHREDHPLPAGPLLPGLVCWLRHQFGGHCTPGAPSNQPLAPISIMTPISIIPLPHPQWNSPSNRPPWAETAWALLRKWRSNSPALMVHLKPSVLSICKGKPGVGGAKTSPGPCPQFLS